MTKQLHIEGLFDTTNGLWERVLTAVREAPGKRAQEEWLRHATGGTIEGDELVVSLPARFSRDFIERRCRPTVEEILLNLAGKPLRVRFVSESADAQPSPPAPESAGSDGQTGAPARSGAFFGQPLNRRYRFDSFVSSENNRFALAAAMAVANAPGHSYNPLFIRGGVGIGKTHLLQAIAHEVHRLHPSVRVAYVPADVFTYEFVSALRERRSDLFRKRYRTVNVWILDDLPFIAGKESTEQEFFQTLSALQETGQQIVLSADRYPKEIPFTDQRLCSRLQSGLIADIGMPDLDARLAILRRKASNEGCQVSDDVLLLVAEMVQSSVRALEGALVKLLAYSSLTRTPLTEALARNVLVGYCSKANTNPSVSVDAIQRAICSFYQVELKALKGKRRDKGIVVPRQVAMYLSRELTDAPLTQIGSLFGGRDHSTVISACNRVKTSLSEDNALRETIEELSKRLQEG